MAKFPKNLSPSALPVSPWLGFAIGGLSGLIATGPMTALMILMHRRLPRDERYPLPPREITMKIAKETRVQEHLSPAARYFATLLAHFGYGAAGGGLYSILAPWTPLPALLKGVIFGSLVWAVSYLGLLPALRVLRPAAEHPARRNALMIVAHLVWGAALALFAELLRSEVANDQQQPLAGQTGPHHDAV